MINTEILSNRLVQVQSLHDRCIDSMSPAQQNLYEYESQEIEQLYQSVQQLNDRKQESIDRIQVMNTQFRSDVLKGIAMVGCVLLMGLVITGGWAEDSTTIVVIAALALGFAFYKHREKQSGLKERIQSYKQMITHQMSEISFLGILTNLVEDILRTNVQWAALDKVRTAKGLNAKKTQEYRCLCMTREIQYFQLSLMTIQKSLPSLAVILETENFNHYLCQSFYKKVA